MPNVFADGDRISGFIDLGKAGKADRWQDLAICYRSLKHNFEGRYNGGFPYPGYHPDMLFEKLGIRPDWEKLKYYLLLDELF
ncbi:phosphotransferase [Lacrimispora saccharolytica]|nr:phosphotransferase [Lacrimispora saccharolytica]